MPRGGLATLGASRSVGSMPKNVRSMGTSTSLMSLFRHLPCIWLSNPAQSIPGKSPSRASVRPAAPSPLQGGALRRVRGSQKRETPQKRGLWIGGLAAPLPLDAVGHQQRADADVPSALEHHHRHHVMHVEMHAPADER